MFTWICPQCGREVPPSYSECPACAEARMKPQQPPQPQPPQPVPQQPQWTPAPPPQQPLQQPSWGAPQQPQWAPPAQSQPQWTPQPPPPPPPQQEPWTPAPQQPVYTIGENNQRKGMPAWLVLLLVAGGLGAALFGFYRFMGRSGSPATAGKEAAFEQPAAIGSSAGHPYAKHLEVTGLRLSEEGGKVKVQFAVVNHSGAAMSGLEMKVALQSTGSKPEDPPLAVVDAKIGNLGPYEVKDLSAQVKTKLRAYELPDWQFLRATFEITAPK